MSRHQVGIGEYAIGHAPDRLVIYGLGSCLGVALYDPPTRIGGLAHLLLPAPFPGVAAGREGKYVQLALPALVGELEAEGAVRARLVAKLVGGAHLFEGFPETPRSGIGQRNLEAARQVLEELAIPVVAEATGGARGRTLEFDLTDGRATVRTVTGDEVVDL